MDSAAQRQAAVALEIDVADMDVRVVPSEIAVAGERAAIVGAGGGRQDTVGVAVGHQLIEAVTGAVLFVDLEALGDPSLVSTAIASLLRPPDGQSHRLSPQ